MIARWLLAAALALPLIVPGAQVALLEYEAARSVAWRLPMVGVDPRDLLRGRYLRARIDWRDLALPADRTACLNHKACYVCRIAADDGAPPRYRLVPRREPRPACEGRLAAPRFLPARPSLQSSKAFRIYLPEDAAPALEKISRAEPERLQLELLVHGDGRARLGRLFLDGEPVGAQ